jgi:flagellar hook-length control protein FliK
MAAKPASGAAITATPVAIDTEDAIAESIGQSFLPQTPLTKVVVNSSAKPQADKKELPDSELENTQSITVMALVSPSVVATVNTPVQTQTTESTEAGAATTLPSAKPTTAAIDTNLVSGKDAEIKSPDVLNQNATGEKVPQPQFSEDGKMMFEEQKPATDKISNDGDVGSRAAVDFTKLDKLVPNKTDVPAINKPLNHPDWSKDVGDRIVWMNNKSLPSAEIRINPEHLGPITVRIDVSQDQATVSFTAQHGVVRDALEASIPKLKEMMAAQNLDLATVSVAQQQSSPNQGQSQAQNFFQMDKQAQNNSANPADELNTVTEALDESQVTVTKGLLSMYA